MNSFTQKNGTKIMVGMNVKFSPWVISDCEKDDKEQMNFGKILKIRKANKELYLEKDFSVVVDVLSTKIVYANHPDFCWEEAQYDLRRLGKILEGCNPEVLKPVGNNEPNFVGYKVGMNTGYIHEDNLFAEIVKQNGTKFVWFVKRQWGSQGKRVDLILGTIPPHNVFVSRANITLTMEELKTINHFLEWLKGDMFTIEEPITCVFCGRSMYRGDISCSEKSMGTGYKGTGAVCKKCCQKIGCSDCNTAREVKKKVPSIGRK